MTGIKPWITAFRLRTLPLAFSGWLVALSIASTQSAIDVTIAMLTLLTAFFLQILSNLANDYGDAVSGVDSDSRKGPSRMVQSGAITKEAMGRAMVVFAVLSFSTGCLLLYLAFFDRWMYAIAFFLVGLSGIAAAIKYTVGKNPYGYAGFGDLFVFVFFGIVLVFGSYFLQVRAFHWWVLLPSISIGSFSIAVLNVNNIRDIDSDRQSGKNSIPVRIGKRKAVFYHALLLAVGFFVSVAYVLITFQSTYSFLFLPVAILFFLHLRAVATKPSHLLDPHLKQMALSTLLYAILFSLGQWIG